MREAPDDCPNRPICEQLADICAFNSLPLPERVGSLRIMALVLVSNEADVRGCFGRHEQGCIALRGTTTQAIARHAQELKQKK